MRETLQIVGLMSLIAAAWALFPGSESANQSEKSVEPVPVVEPEKVDVSVLSPVDISDVMRNKDQGKPEWQSHVYSVQVRASSGGAVRSGGTAVSIGDGKFLTAAHVVFEARRPVVEVKIEDKWVSGSFTPIRGDVDDDLALIQVPVDKLPEFAKKGVATRSPKYLERVQVYGLATAVVQSGIYSNIDTVSLDAGSAGTKNGDSGGGVFGADGSLVGIIRGGNPDLKEVVYCTDGRLHAAKSSAVAAPVVAKPATPAASNCPDGQCQLPSYSVRTGPFGRVRKPARVK